MWTNLAMARQYMPVSLSLGMPSHLADQQRKTLINEPTIQTSAVYHALSKDFLSEEPLNAENYQSDPNNASYIVEAETKTPVDLCLPVALIVQSMQIQSFTMIKNDYSLFSKVTWSPYRTLRPPKYIL
jgi:hypothetical protein